MIRKTLEPLVLLTLLASVALCARLQRSAASASRGAPDLLIAQLLFPPTNDKSLRVQVANKGNAAARACRLLLTVSKINGVAVSRAIHVNVPNVAPGKDVWLFIDAKTILPKNISLEATTFKLDVDATEIVSELNEANNELWHNR
jgi:hypothetical protein